MDALFSFVARVVVAVVKGFLKFMLFTLPIQFVIAALFLGGIAGNAAAGDKYKDFFVEKSGKLTHTVTIQWDDFDKTKMNVREDLDWTINGANLKQDLYADSTVSTPSISNASKGGKIFMGLYTAPDGGGTQFVNAKGYSVKAVKQDLTLYPYWE